MKPLAHHHRVRAAVAAAGIRRRGLATRAQENKDGAPYFEKLLADFKEHYFLMDDLAKKYAPHPPPAYHPSRPSRCSSNMDPTCLGSTWGRRGVRTASHTAATIRFTRSTHTGAVSPPEGGIESGPCALDGEGSGF